MTTSDVELDDWMREFTVYDADDIATIQKEVPTAEPSSEMDDDYEYWEQRAVEAMEFERWCEKHPSEFEEGWFHDADSSISKSHTKNAS